LDFSRICFYTQSNAVHSMMISLAFHYCGDSCICCLSNWSRHEGGRWPNALSSQYKLASTSIRSAFIQMFFKSMSVNASQKENAGHNI